MNTQSQDSPKEIKVHLEPADMHSSPAEDCIDCRQTTRHWLDPHTPLCESCCERRNKVIRGMTHPQIHLDFYEWWDKSKMSEQDRRYLESNPKPFDLAMFVWTRSREVLWQKAKVNMVECYRCHTKYPAADVGCPNCGGSLRYGNDNR